jgi:hypothetical protein
MTTKQNFAGGATGGSTAYFLDTGSHAASSVVVPAGNLNLAGQRPLRIASISPDRAAGTFVTRIRFGGTDYAAGATIANCAGGTGESRIYKTGGSQVDFRRASSGGTTELRNSSGVTTYTWPGAMAGSYQWGTVPTQPGVIGATRVGRSVTLVFAGSSSNGGYSISRYLAQYSTDGGATWSTAVPFVSGQTFTDLPAGLTYTFRVYAENAVGFSQARVSASVFVPAGGRIWDGAAEDLTTVAVRWDGAAEIPLVTAVRWDGSAEVPLS